MVAAAEAAAHIGEMRVDPLRPDVAAGFAEEGGDRFGRLLRGLDADHELHHPPGVVVPGESRLGLEEHRIDGLGLEAALEHQPVVMAGREVGADARPVIGGLLVGGTTAVRPGPDRPLALAEAPRHHPAGLDRGVDVGRVRRRAGDAHEAERRVRIAGPRSGLAPIGDGSRSPQRQARLVEGVEILEDQHADRWPR
jgi:hypothetical protein